MALIGEIDLNGAGFLKTLGSLETGLGGFVSSLSAVAGPVGIAVAALGALTFVATQFGDALKLGGDLADLSAQTGESAGELVILRTAFENAGLGAEAVGPTLQKLQDSISGVNESGKSTAGALKALGVSAGELRNLSALGQIERLQQGFEKLDQTTRVQVGRDLFGKLGGKGLSLFTDREGLDQARRQAGPLAELMDKNVESFDKLGDVVGQLKLNFQEFFAGALSQFAPEATNIADALASIDFVGFGEAAGVVVSAVLKIGEALAAVAPIINFASEAISSLVGSGNRANAGLADKYRGFSRAARPDESSVSTGRTFADSLASVAGGGFSGSVDAQVSEAKTHTGLLREISTGIRALQPTQAPSPPDLNVQFSS